MCAFIFCPFSFALWIQLEICEQFFSQKKERLLFTGYSANSVYDFFVRFDNCDNFIISRRWKINVLTDFVVETFRNSNFLDVFDIVKTFVQYGQSERRIKTLRHFFIVQWKIPINLTLRQKFWIWKFEFRTSKITTIVSGITNVLSCTAFSFRCECLFIWRTVFFSLFQKLWARAHKTGRNFLQLNKSKMKLR